MKTRLATPNGRNKTCAATEPVPGSKPVLALLRRLLWAMALMLPMFGAKGGVVLTTLHSFGVLTNGVNPFAALVLGRDGNFYGTTENGGMNKEGTVFQITSNGILTTLYSFTGGNDGGNPAAALVQGGDGNFYGTTSSGGDTNNYDPWGYGAPGSGTVFKISTNGALTTLFIFTEGNVGGVPNGLVQGSDGYFYGTTLRTVFQISSNGNLTTLFSFTGGVDDGSPLAALVQASDGYLYGTTENGGASSAGTVFKIATNGSLTSLYSFTGGNDGGNPAAALVQGSDGYLYGTTENCGANNAGTVFKIATNGSLTSLYSFTGGNDGGTPNAALLQGGDGDFYGTTSSGGETTSIFLSGAGTVFKISANGVLTTLYSFTGLNDGGDPNGLIQGSDGSFYGTTSGDFNLGVSTVFQISSNGTLTTLYSFTAGDGEIPNAGLVQGSDGYFYGTTILGGSNNAGAVFKISATGSLASLYSFTGGKDGFTQNAALVQGGDGDFYGTTFFGGITSLPNYSWGAGTVFKISANGALTNLYSFTGLNDGGGPNGLAQDSDGYFYGTTENGGTNKAGTVFQISANGLLTSLYSFTGGSDGGSPAAALAQGGDGYFYGTTENGGTNNAGTVFKISANGSLTSLYSFTGGSDGGSPAANLVQGSDGYFYGTTLNGGAHNAGTVFKINSNGPLTSLHSFTIGSNGRSQAATLARGDDGYFYGTTTFGGINNAGTVFKIDTNGSLTTLNSFTGGNDGGAPSGLIQGSDGSFYGTTTYGGAGGDGGGTVFRLTIVPDLQLTIIPSEANVVLEWPTNYGSFSYAGYSLQTTTNLGLPAVWTPVAPSPVVIGGQYKVTIPPSGTQRFFRLSQ